MTETKNLSKIINTLLKLDELTKLDCHNIKYIIQDELVEDLNLLYETEIPTNLKATIKELIYAIDNENEKLVVPYELYASDFYEYLDDIVSDDEEEMDINLDDEIWKYTE